jgi:ABC-type glycerol-3-phosphate transport system substrate-binding protein
MEEKQKKTLIIAGVVVVILLIATTILFLLRGDTGDPSQNPEEQASVTLTYWGLWEPPSVMQPVIDEFEAANPNIKIAYSQQTFSNYESRLFTRLQQATGNEEPAPDIFRIHNTWTPKYYSYLAPMPAEIMSVEEYQQKFYPTALNDFTAKNGNIYAIPWEIDGLMVFYNKQLLAEEGVTEPPEDWDSFFELARDLTKRDASGRILQAGLAIGTSRNIMHSAEILAYMLALEDIQVMDQTRTQISLNTPRVQRVFETYTNFAKGDNALWSPSLRNDLEMFFTGDLAMMIAPSWRAFDIIQAAPSIEFDTAPLPQLLANEEDIYYATYWGDAVNRTSANPLAAWEFIAFLAQKEQQMKLYSNASQIRAFGEPYSLVELNSEMLNKPYVSAIAQMAPNMRSYPWGDETLVNSTINTAITDIIEGRSDVDSALEDAEAVINATIEQTNR